MAELQAIRDFVNQSATPATFSYSQLNVNYQDDELRGNGEGEEEEEEEDEDPPAPSSAFQDAPASAASSSKPRVTLRLSGGSSSSSSSAAQTQSFTSQFELGKELSQIDTGNLSSLLEEIGYMQGEDENQWDFGAGGPQVESSKVSWGDCSHDSYKAMSMSAKMEWFDKHGEKLIKDPNLIIIAF